MTTTNRPKSLSTEVVHFRAFEDGSGVDLLIEARYGYASARFALNVLGDVDQPTLHTLGSGLTTHMTHKAAGAARVLATRVVRELGEEWLRKNSEMYREEA